jgi:hypothetical protein
VIYRKFQGQNPERERDSLKIIYIYSSELPVEALLQQAAASDETFPLSLSNNIGQVR